MSRNFLFLLLLIITSELFAQQSPIDSIATFSSEKSLLQKIALKNRINQYFQNIENPNDGITEAKAYHELATQLQDSFFIGNSNLILSKVFAAQKDTINSQDYLNKYHEIIDQYGICLADFTGMRVRFYQSLKIMEDVNGSLQIEDVVKNENAFHVNNTKRTYQIG